MSSIIRERHQPISAQSSASSSIDGGYSSTTPSSYPHTDHNNNQHQQQNSSLSSSSSSSTSSACDQQQYCHLFSETNHNRRRHHHHHFHHHHHHPHSGLIGHIGFGMAGIDSGNNHGIGDCNPNPRNYCKLLFKITIVLLSFAGFLYQATDICAHYFSYRTVVYTNTEQDSLVDLPSITFCLPTYFTKQSLEQLYSPYIKRNLEEMSAFKNQSMLDAIKPVIYETFQKQAFKDLSAAQILDGSISDDGIIECRLFYPPQHWPNLTRERMYEIVQYGLPCEEVTQVISSINANGKCFTFFSQLLTDNDSLKAYHTQSASDSQVLEYQQYPQMTSFASSSASSASTRSTGPVAPPIVQHSRYVPVSHKISVNHGYRFHSGRFIRLQIQFNRNQYTVISDGHQRECIQVHPPFKIPSEACIHSINPGMSYDFVLTKTKAILQPPPYQTNCQSYQAVTQAESELLASSSDPSELKEFYLKPMSRSDCIDKCMIHIYEKYCGCLPIHISIWQRSSLFLNMSVCDYEDFERIAPCLEKELSSTCYDTCKSDCIDRHYHLHVESRVYPSDEQIKQATGVERIRLKRLRQSAATISIWSNYLSDITYVHTPAMSLIQLICYLGGLAGLWLGVSVMTVSGWLAQLYPFMQKWNYKQRYILLTARQNMRYFYDSFRFRQAAESKLPDYHKTSMVEDCCYNPNSKTCCLLDNHQNSCCSDDSGCFDLNDKRIHQYHPISRSSSRMVKELHHQKSSSSSTSESATDTPSHIMHKSSSQTENDECETEAILRMEEENIFNQSNHQLDQSSPSSNKSSTLDLNGHQLQSSINIGKNVSNMNHNRAFINDSNSNNDTASGNDTNNRNQQQHQQNYNQIRSHPHTIARRAVYWSNYSSMSTSSDDLSLISSSTNSTNISNSGISVSGNGGVNASTILRRLSLINSPNPAISNLAKYSYRV
uniref:Uncharacterized protein LOC113799642 n=1 Tax=Dermatophagoides pteronyssinus TaxID=6956 RepID=A0A6P6YMM9_DERPT|nr:uncharacterized protein LOC113799642 [Dermatophagoides pteronyssinus]